MGVTETAKIKILNPLGSSAKTFKKRTFKGGRSAYQKKRLFRVPVIQFLNLKNLNRRELNARSFFFYAKMLYHAYHEIVRNFQTNV
jgi:hypothetical protein